MCDLARIKTNMTWPKREAALTKSGDFRDGGQANLTNPLLVGNSKLAKLRSSFLSKTKLGSVKNDFFH